MDDQPPTVWLLTEHDGLYLVNRFFADAGSLAALDGVRGARTMHADVAALSRCDVHPNGDRLRAAASRRSCLTAHDLDGASRGASP